MQRDYDLFVIGGGSGGVRCARIAAQHGARVGIAEEFRWGGTCVIRGCVPKKLMVYASEIRHMIDDARGFGWTIDAARFDWPMFIAAKDKEITRLSAIYGELLGKAGAKIFDGRAVITGPHSVELKGETISAQHIVVATGGTPSWPDNQHEGWVSSNEIFHLPELPRRIVIYGGGYIALEFAHIFAGMGAEVTLVFRAEQALRGFDQDVRDHVMLGLARVGIVMHPGRTVVANRAAPDGGRVVVLDDGTELPCSVAMSAIGRAPATTQLGLEQVGVKVNLRGGIIVDDFSRTNVPSIYAIGDVTDRVTLTPIAIREGHALADTLFGGKPTPVSHQGIATAVFAQPPVGVVGLSESDAHAAGHDVQVFRSTFRPMRNVLAGRDDKTMMKLVIDRSSRKVLGVHMVGADAPEIIQMAAIALAMGATKDDFDRTVAVHPTAAEEFVLMRG
ncbi:MAG: glutathione-disulfide reductase [Kofleriaceae bacterium]|nr:glutathione-disulfide reductase [Kofleriaceae bacterium]